VVNCQIILALGCSEILKIILKAWMLIIFGRQGWDQKIDKVGSS
jgi:hypothetical protein